MVVPCTVKSPVTVNAAKVGLSPVCNPVSTLVVLPLDTSLTVP